MPRGVVGRVALASALTLVLLVGCTRATPAFPGGAWWVQDPGQGTLVLEFHADGTVAGGGGTPGQNPATVEVREEAVPGETITYSVQADVLTLSYACGEDGRDAPYERVEATYRWAVRDELMTLTEIDDPCPSELDGSVWAKVEPAHADPISAPVPWWNDEVFYEVFVRSFADSDGDGDGDLQGLVGKLPYLEDLGVTALWLMPIMQSPSYHGYDITDYDTVESGYGTNADFQALVDAAHARGIEVIVDLVLNHTSSEHPWFIESARGADSPKRDWYVWRDDDPGTVSFFSGGPAWHPSGDAYYYGFFSEKAPDLNYRNPEVTARMQDVARFWLEDLGADGFRMDSIAHLIEDGDQLVGTQQTHDWLAAWDEHLDSVDPKALTVGEVFDTTQAIASYVNDDEVDIAFTFPLADALVRSVNAGDPAVFASQLRRVLADFPPGQFAPFLANHDQNRVMTQLDADLGMAKLAAAALLTLPGVPFLYYGEEIGMVGEKPDPTIRTPMQWDATDGAGFTTGTPWEPVNADFVNVNVAAQVSDPASLLSHYRRLLHLRAEHPALSLGGLQTLDSACPGLAATLRRTADGTDTVVVLLNFAATQAVRCELNATASTLPPGSYRSRDLLTGADLGDLVVGEEGRIAGAPVPSIGPRGAVVMGLLPR